jgi:hypothetical protein
MNRVIFSLSLLLLFCLVNESLLMAQSRAVRQRGLSLGNVFLGLGSSRQPRLGGSAVGVLLGSRFPGLDGPHCTPRRDQIPSRRQQIPSRRDQVSAIEPPADSPRMRSRVEAPVAPPRMVSRIQVEESSPAGPSIIASNATR